MPTAMIRIIQMVKPMSMCILIWVMTGGEAGTIPGIIVRGTVLTGPILTGIVPMGDGVGEAMEAGTARGIMIPGTMEDTTDITVVTMVDIMAVTMVDTTAVIMAITIPIIPDITVITAPTTPGTRADGRQQLQAEAVAVRITCRHQQLTGAVRRLLHQALQQEVLLQLQAAVPPQQALPDAARRW